MYAAALCFTNMLWPFVFLFSLPLFYIAVKNKLTFLNGYVWGITFFSLHLHDAAYTISTMGNGSLALTLIPGFFIILYMSLYSALWFWITQKFITFFCINKPINIILIFTFSLLLYITFIDTYALWVFNRIEGYPLAHPLLSLVHKPYLLTLLPYIGKITQTFFLLLPSTLLFLFIYTNKIKWIVTFIFSCMPWLISPLFFVTEQAPAWINQIACIPVTYPKSIDTQSLIDGAMHDIKKTLFAQPNTTIIIFPESSFYCDDLVNHRQKLQTWNRSGLNATTNIIVGGFRKKDKKLYNCLYWVYDGQLKLHYDKTHSMPLIEKIPQWCNWSWLHKIYFINSQELSPGEKTQPILKLSNNLTVIPYICSELFFSQTPSDPYTHPILLIANDRWFSSLYLPELLHRVARLKAILWKRPIIYCSFKYKTICNSNGQIW